MDLVVPAKKANVNEELRFSLRSAYKNVPHDQLIVAGYKPPWVLNAIHVSTKQGSNKYRNTTEAMRAVCESPEVSEDFIYWNDDFFAIQQLQSVPKLNRGPLDNIIELYRSKGGRYYAQGMEQTRDLLLKEGFRDLLSYELHVPMIINKEAMLAALDLAKGSGINCLHKRTLYGNFVNYGGQTIEDVKVYNGSQDWNVDLPFLSTSDESFQLYGVGQWIREQFPEKSPYEPQKPDHVQSYHNPRQPGREQHKNTGKPVHGQVPFIVPELGESE